MSDQNQINQQNTALNSNDDSGFFGRVMSDYNKEMKKRGVYKKIYGNVDAEQAKGLIDQIEAGSMTADYALSRSKKMISPLQASLIKDYNNPEISTEALWSKYSTGLDDMTAAEFSKFNSLTRDRRISDEKALKATTKREKTEQEKRIKMISAKAKLGEVIEDIVKVAGDIPTPPPGTTPLPPHEELVAQLESVLEAPDMVDYEKLYAELYDYAETIDITALKGFYPGGQFMISATETDKTVRYGWVQAMQRDIQSYIGKVTSAHQVGLSSDERGRPPLQSFQSSTRMGISRKASSFQLHGFIR